MTSIFESVLNGIYSFVGNYGWSVVIFTLLVRLVLLPLDVQSRKSMRALSKVQPKAMELQKKYANDKDKLNRKISELYKKEHVNPLMGCLPMLLQLVVLFIMFNYMPLFGLQLAFKKFDVNLGIAGSPWTGLTTSGSSSFPAIRSGG